MKLKYTPDVTTLIMMPHSLVRVRQVTPDYQQYSLLQDLNARCIVLHELTLLMSEHETADLLFCKSSAALIAFLRTVCVSEDPLDNTAAQLFAECDRVSIEPAPWDICSLREEQRRAERAEDLAVWGD